MTGVQTCALPICKIDVVGRGRAAAQSHPVHGDGFHRRLFGQAQLFTYPGHGVDGIVQLNLKEPLQLAHQVPKLGKNLVESRLEVGNLVAFPVVYRNTLPDVDGDLAANKQG